MKNLLAFATLFLFVATTSVVQAQDGKYMHSSEYTFDFSDEVLIRIGGAAQTKSTSEWETDGTVGKHTIDKKTFNALKEATTGKFRIEIETKKVGTLHAMKVTDVQNGNILKGIYNEKDRKFTFGSAKTQQQGGATKTDIGVVKGQLSEDMSKITDGEFGIAFILGNSGAILTANAVFYFEANSVK